MNHAQKYLFFIKGVFSTELQKIGYEKDSGIHRPMTKREYLDSSFKHFLRMIPETFLVIKSSDFIKDNLRGPKNSVYMKI
ncbi:MAG: hypothetical protein LBJ67_15735, partial [Planctomycetaceae bacterium]|nr:hypothetical protein [Planctomycetaceae bacterium]